MTLHRLASLALGVGTATVALSPRIAGAQIMTVAATELSSRAWLGNACVDMACLRNKIAHNFSLTFVPVGASAELFRRAEAFVPSTDLSAFESDCPDCEVGSRPFMIPSGLLLQLAGGASDKSHANAVKDDDSKRSGGAEVTAAAHVGAASLASTAAVGNAAAVTPVTSNPEPATIALMATGLVGLVPVLRRRRRD